MKTGLNFVVLTALICFAASAIHADEASRRKRFDKNHPRRAEVLGRANNEQKKNNAAEANGQITQKQDNKLNRQDQSIKREEQRQAAENGGHITKAEQAKDNRQENRVNQERNNMEKRDAAAGGTTPVSAPATGQ